MRKLTEHELKQWKELCENLRDAGYDEILIQEAISDIQEFLIKVKK